MKYKVTIKNISFEGGVPIETQFSEASYTVEASNSFDAENLAMKHDRSANYFAKEGDSTYPLQRIQEITVQTVEPRCTQLRVLHLGGRNLI